MTSAEWRGGGPAGRRPTISIIIATWNAAEALPHTLRSIRSSTGASLEWLVVDGASRDGTIDLLRANEDVITWKSEPDKGIYDAWNKGSARATGDWLLFLGAGDEFVQGAPATREATLSGAHPAHNIVYGRMQYLSPHHRHVIEEVGEPWERLAGRWELMRPALPNTNAAFHHRSLFEAGMRFDPALSIAADAELMLRAIAMKPPLYMPEIVSRSTVGGVSFRISSALQIRRQIREINRRLGLTPPLSHVIDDTLALAAKMAIGSCLPERAGHVVADALRALQGKPRRWTVR